MKGCLLADWISFFTVTGAAAGSGRGGRSGDDCPGAGAGRQDFSQPRRLAVKVTSQALRLSPSAELRQQLSEYRNQAWTELSLRALPKPATIRRLAFDFMMRDVFRT